MICWSTAMISHQSLHISTPTEEAQKHLNSQGNLRRAKFPGQVQEQWKINHKLAQDREALEWVNRSIQKIVGTDLLSDSDIGEMRFLQGAQRILKENTIQTTACCCCCSVQHGEVSAVVSDYKALSLKLWFILHTAALQSVFVYARRDMWTITSGTQLNITWMGRC